MADSSKDIQLHELKDMINDLKKMIKTLQATVDAANKREESLTQERDNLKEEIDLLRKKLFGTSSEKRTIDIPGQLNFFNEAELEQNPEAVKAEDLEALLPEKTAKKRKARATDAERFKGVPVEKKYLELSEEEKLCPSCGTPLKEIGEEDNTPGDVVLSVQHLSTKFEPYLKDVSFDVRKGEIFGLYGLVGAGRTELMETIFGVRTRAAGRVYFNNHLMNFESAKDAMEHGFAMITEERKANGLFLKGDLTFNTTIANLKQYKSGIALSDSKMEKATAEEIKTMRTKCMGPNDMISNLSGGNQQKVIFGKWLEREPQVFMMDEPTRGIDVGAKYEIYELIINMAKQGRTIIVVSSEMPEILGITNRIGVMSNGYLSGIVNTKETNQEELLRLSAKYL